MALGADGTAFFPPELGEESDIHVAPQYVLMGGKRPWGWRGHRASRIRPPLRTSANPPFYSYRRASIGLSRAARQAG